VRVPGRTSGARIVSPRTQFPAPRVPVTRRPSDHRRHVGHALTSPRRPACRPRRPQATRDRSRVGAANQAARRRARPRATQPPPEPASPPTRPRPAPR
jgi:hypothetical protein